MHKQRLDEFVGYPSYTILKPVTAAWNAWRSIFQISMAFARSSNNFYAPFNEGNVYILVVNVVVNRRKRPATASCTSFGTMLSTRDKVMSS